MPTLRNKDGWLTPTGLRSGLYEQRSWWADGRQHIVTLRLTRNGYLVRHEVWRDAQYPQRGKRMSFQQEPHKQLQAARQQFTEYTKGAPTP